MGDVDRLDEGVGTEAAIGQVAEGVIGKGIGARGIGVAESSAGLEGKVAAIAGKNLHRVDRATGEVQARHLAVTVILLQRDERTDGLVLTIYAGLHRYGHGVGSRAVGGMEDIQGEGSGIGRCHGRAGASGARHQVGRAPGVVGGTGGLKVKGFTRTNGGIGAEDAEGRILHGGDLGRAQGAVVEAEVVDGTVEEGGGGRGIIGSATYDTTCFRRVTNRPPRTTVWAAIFDPINIDIHILWSSDHPSHMIPLIEPKGGVAIF